MIAYVLYWLLQCLFEDCSYKLTPSMIMRHLYIYIKKILNGSRAM